MPRLFSFSTFVLAGAFLLVFPLLTGEAQASTVNINTASESELTTLPSIGPSRASAIVEFRRTNGPFRTIEDLQQVPGIGPGTMNNIRGMITVGDPDEAQPADDPGYEAEPPARARGGDRPPARSADEGDVIDLSDAPPRRGEIDPGAETAPRAPERPATPAASPAPQASGDLININTAGRSELVRLPMIGAARADAIIADREERGPFRSVHEITRVPGIGDGILRQIQELITVGEVE